MAGLRILLGVGFSFLADLGLLDSPSAISFSVTGSFTSTTSRSTFFVIILSTREEGCFSARFSLSSPSFSFFADLGLLVGFFHLFDSAA
jgi:hypothetical protein